MAVILKGVLARYCIPIAGQAQAFLFSVCRWWGKSIDERADTLLPLRVG